MQTGTKRIKTNQNGTKANAVTVVHEFSHIFSYIRKPGDPGEQEKCHPRSESDAAGCCRMLPGFHKINPLLLLVEGALRLASFQHLPKFRTQCRTVSVLSHEQRFPLAPRQTQHEWWIEACQSFTHWPCWWQVDHPNCENSHARPLPQWCQSGVNPSPKKVDVAGCGRITHELPMISNDYSKTATGFDKASDIETLILSHTQ